MRRYFGTDGIRGRVGSTLINSEFFSKLGYVTAKLLDGRVFVIGRDTRESSKFLEEALMSGFLSAGGEVILGGVLPTPAVAYLTRFFSCDLGGVISASHNYYQDNGVKFFGPGGNKINDDLEKQIETELDIVDFSPANKSGTVSVKSAHAEYINFCKSTVPGLDLSGLKVVVDCANGACYSVAPRIFRELGAEVKGISCRPTGYNINYKCGVMHPSNVSKAVKSLRYDLGIAFDGDGDRVMVVDSSGKIYNGDDIIYTLAKFRKFKGCEGSGVVGTQMSNLGLEIALKELGFDFVRAKVGDRYVLEEMNRLNYFLGGESSGHVVCLDKHSTGDGIIAVLQLLFALQEMKVSLLDLSSGLIHFPQVLINLAKCKNWEEKSADIVNEAKEDLGMDGRILVRMSGTEPVLRVMVEARDEINARRWALKIAESLK